MIQLNLESPAPTRPVTSRSKFKLSLGVVCMPTIFRSSVYENAPPPSLVPVPVEKVLCDSKIDKSNVHEIILVSGSTCILVLFKLVSHFSISKEPNMSINPDESVVYGAAVQAAILSADTSEMIFSSTLPLFPSVSVLRLMEGPLACVTLRPHLKSEIFSAYSDSQAGMLIQVYEGECARTKDNNLLSKFELFGIPPAPRGVPQLKLFLIFNANGILKGKSNCIIITIDKDSFLQSD